MGELYQLICVDGEDNGKIFHIKEGLNRVGRGYQMDICLQRDLEITRDNHFTVIYDVLNGIVRIKPSVGILTYVNNKRIDKARILNVGDEIRIGQSCLKLVIA